MMATFSFSRISDFEVPSLDPLNIAESVASCGHARRREELFADPNKATLSWLAMAAEFSFDTASFGESDAYSNRLGIAATEAGDDLSLAKAYLFQGRCAVAYRSVPKAIRRIEQLKALEDRSKEPFARAARLCIRSLANEKCSTSENPLPIEGKDDWANIFVALKEAAKLYLEADAFDHSILCHVEYALAKVAHGEYLTSVEWAERGLRIARDHSAWKWTGRLLQIASSAATDQGYRHGVEATIRKALSWTEFVGDQWGRIEALTALGRFLMFEMPSLSRDMAAEPDRLLTEAIDLSRALGTPWLMNRAEHARVFLLRKSGAGEVKHVLFNSPEAARVSERIDLDIPKRIHARLEDGIADSPDAFLLFSAVRNEESVCEDFLNEYRNQIGGQVVGKGPAYVALLSELADNPYLAGLMAPLHDVVENRIVYEDVINLNERGEQKWFRRLATPSGDGAVVKLRDITTERKAEEALRSAAESALRSERIMSEFLANMSHEIRTPISGVLGLARMLSETDLTADQQTYVKYIMSSGDILLGIIGNILDLSKIEAGYVEITNGPVALRDLVADISGLYLGQAESKCVVLSNSIGREVPSTVLMDGVRLRQILANLIGNAVKFTSEGSVSIIVEAKQDRLVFTIEDTGIGIPSHKLTAIFDRFQQAGHPHAHSGGSGLGLTISRRLAELMGGTISVTSDNGTGSRFTVDLPLIAAETKEKVVAEELPARFDGIRVLLVEDNPVNQVVSAHFLRKFGCIVSKASNGAEAVKLVESQEFDIVFMDVRMPIMDGLEATRQIREMQSGTGIWTMIVALTAGALNNERDMCLEAGMDEYISKPFADDSLKGVLARLSKTASRAP